MCAMMQKLRMCDCSTRLSPYPTEQAFPPGKVRSARQVKQGHHQNKLKLERVDIAVTHGEQAVPRMADQEVLAHLLPPGWVLVQNKVVATGVPQGQDELSRCAAVFTLALSPLKEAAYQRHHAMPGAQIPDLMVRGRQGPQVPESPGGKSGVFQPARSPDFFQGFLQKRLY